MSCLACDDDDMTSAPSIREATPADAEAIASLVEHYWSFEDIPGFQFERVKRLLEECLADARVARAWMATSQGEVCGYLLAVLVFSLEQGGLTAEIDEFFVAPDARESGVGLELLRTAEQALAEAGCVRVQLQLGRQNDHARAFYQRRGYEERSGYELLDKPLAGK
jgi:ribosomal protein S18 acetylase RimI-like enzyme